MLQEELPLEKKGLDTYQYSVLHRYNFNCAKCGVCLRQQQVCFLLPSNHLISLQIPVCSVCKEKYNEFTLSLGFPNAALQKPKSDEFDIWHGVCSHLHHFLTGELPEEVCLVSGMDSLITWFRVGFPKALYFDLGHRYAAKEKESVLNVMNKLRANFEVVDIIKLGSFENEDATIPGRNAILALAAAQFGDLIYLTVQKGETNIPDRTKGAFEVMSSATQIVGPAKWVLTPWFEKTKAQMIKWYLDEGNPEEYLLEISTCYRDTPDLYCSECPACFRKFVALDYCGVDCKKYIDIPKLMSWSGTQEYARKMLDNQYIMERVNETLPVLQKYGVI